MKKILLLITEESKSHQDGKLCYICGKKNLKKVSKCINCWKVWDNLHYTDKYRGTGHSIFNLIWLTKSL